MQTSWNRADTAWFRRAGWGVFTHYLTKPTTSADEWNRQVDACDVAALAEQIASVGARYLFFTIGQGSGHYCAPNATYDRYAGISPSKCSRRDLISDLYAAMQPRGVELLAYVPADGPWADPEARKGLGITAHWSDDPSFDWGPGAQWAKFRLPEFQRRWEDVCRDWSLRFGRKVRGWWVDGAYACEQRYPPHEAPNFHTYATALKAGNPDAIVAFNPGVKVPVPTELVVGYTRYVNAQGGVVTWDVPISPEGRIPEPFLAQLRAINDPPRALG